MVRNMAKALLHDVSMLERLYTGPSAKGMSKTMLNVGFCPVVYQLPRLSYLSYPGPVPFPKATRSLPLKRVLPRSVEDGNDRCPNSPRGSEGLQIPVAD